MNKKIQNKRYAITIQYLQPAAELRRCIRTFEASSRATAYTMAIQNLSVNGLVEGADYHLVSCSYDHSS